MNSMYSTDRSCAGAAHRGGRLGVRSHASPASQVGGLAVGPADDALEREADQAATQVMRGGIGGALPLSGAGFEGVSVQRQCAACEEEPKVQRKSTVPAAGGMASPQLSQQILSARGGGSPLERPLRGMMEQGFGHSFGAVRIHTDAAAATMSQSLGAQAFTVGNDIFFDRGQYAPGSEGGRQLLAHELAHTLQQGGGIGRKIQRSTWGSRTAACDTVGVEKGRVLTSVTINQNPPQSVTLNWSDGKVETDITSTGKGQCCVDAKDPDAIACDENRSQMHGSNCTPITSDKPHLITDRYINYNGLDYMSMFAPKRLIGFHEYDPVNGEPLSHGCARLKPDMAKKIYCGAQQNKTEVHVKGYPKPLCSSKEVVNEWQWDIGKGLEQQPKDKNSHADNRKMLKETFQVPYSELNAKLKDAQIGTGDKLPRCSLKAPLPVNPNGVKENP